MNQQKKNYPLTLSLTINSSHNNKTQKHQTKYIKEKLNKNCNNSFQMHCNRKIIKGITVKFPNRDRIFPLHN